jgi:SAM-dependent methyltransferase
MERGRALSFGSVAELYDAFRPSPPAALAAELGRLEGREVLEIAAGTGKCTRFLVARGARVTAVEPDDQMRAVLERRSPTVAAHRARAERLPFEDEAFDVVVTSSAWHWFEQPEALDEIARVLRDGGELVVMGNGFDRECPWLVELLALREHDEAHNVGVKAQDLSLDDDERFSLVSRFRVGWEWLRDVESMVQLFRTYSGVIARPAPEIARLDDIVRDVLGPHVRDGVLVVPMAVLGVRGRRAAR